MSGTPEPRRSGSPVPSLDDLKNRLRRAWEDLKSPGMCVDLNALLLTGGETVRSVEVQELLKLDMQIRQQRDLSFDLLVYKKQFPRLFELCPLSPELIYHEYQLWQHLGNAPSLSTYCERYPEHANSLTRLSRESKGTNLDETRATRSGPSTADLPVVKHSSGITSALSQHYRMIRKLGAGAYGEVWLAEAPGGVEVAIKRIFRSLNHEEGHRELQVLKLIKGLRHPFLLQTQAYWQEDDRLCIVMDLADCSLRDQLMAAKKRGLSGIPAEELLPYFKETAEALDFLHEKHLQHRDIKPENILLLKGHAKVADFGLTREIDGDMMNATFCGSPVYMAPEVFNQSISAHSDQYSLACTYAELRVGEHPIKGKNLHDLMMVHIKGEKPNLDPLPPAEQEVIHRAMSRDPHARFANCTEFVQALVEANEPPQPPPVPPPPKPSYLLAATLAMVAVGVGVAWAIHSLRPPSSTTPTEKTHPELVSPWLPEGGEPAGEDVAINRTVPSQPLYETIVLTKGGQKFTFVLIPGYAAMSRFYMLRDKVSNAQFRAASEDEAYLKLLAELEKGQPAPPKGEKRHGYWKDFAQNDNWPVRGITVTEAYCFARWLGGNLPTMEQWDRAAGVYDGDPGPFEKGWTPPEVMTPDNEDIAVGGRATPLPVGEAKRDRSRYGCRDMAGNGLEWTRSLRLISVGNAMVPLKDPQRDDRVELRGREFTKNSPLVFKKFTPLQESYLGWQETISFRVMLEIPEPRQ